MEADCDFTRHLHNGDPLSTTDASGITIWLRTVKEPPGRPATWPAPKTETDPWIWSALDALSLKGFTTATDWSVPAILWRFEQYNGMGYHYHNNPSPYLWSGSQIYKRGKYIEVLKDGEWKSKYDPNLVSNQVGSALVLKQLLAGTATS
jgi:lysozyme family protein